MTGVGLSEFLAHRPFQDRQMPTSKSESRLRSGIRSRLGKHAQKEKYPEFSPSFPIRASKRLVEKKREKYGYRRIKRRTGENLRYRNMGLTGELGKVRTHIQGRNMVPIQELIGGTVTPFLSRNVMVTGEVGQGRTHLMDIKLEGGLGEAIGTQIMHVEPELAIPILSWKTGETVPVTKKKSKFLKFIDINIYIKYKSRISELENEFDKDRKRTFNKDELREIDTIRSFALKNKIFPKESDAVLEKSRRLLLNYFETSFAELQKKIKPYEIPTIEYDREKMRLFYLKLAIKEDDPRSLQELEKEHRSIRKEIEALTQKVMGIF